MLVRIPISIICGIMLCSPGLHSREIHKTVAQPQHTIEQALDENRDAIMALPGVIGTGLSLCKSQICIKVLVLKDSPQLRQRLDELLGQHPYAVEQTDPIRTLPAED